MPASLETRQRAERRISVRLPMKVRGRDIHGLQFEESTACENLCRSGAAFLSRFDLDKGADLEITIPSAQHGSRRYEADFATQGRVVHVGEMRKDGDRLVGVHFTGPRFQRVFRPESAA